MTKCLSDPLTKSYISNPTDKYFFCGMFPEHFPQIILKETDMYTQTYKKN